MKLEEFKRLPESKMLDILDSYAVKNFEEGETSACDFEYGRSSDASTIGFNEFLNTIESQKPLTDKILELNGFKYYHKNFASLSPNDAFQLEMIEWPNEDGIGLWMIGGVIRIRYVDELQSAMKLAGMTNKLILED